MRTVRDTNRRVTLIATPRDRVSLLGEMQRVVEYFNGKKRIGGASRMNLERAWNNIPLSATGFAHLIGKTRQVITRHGLKSRTPHNYGHGRLTGHVNPEDVQHLLTVAHAMLVRSPVSKEPLDALFKTGTSSRLLLIRLLGTSEHLLSKHYINTETEMVDAYRLLSKPNRPRRSGHPVPSEDVGEPEREDSADDGRDSGAEGDEPVDSGPVHAAAWLADLEHSPNQVEGELPDDAEASAGDVSPADLTPVPEMESAYPEIAEVDESGDSYLEDLLLPAGDDSLAGFQDWVQEFED